jgi:hypothetical protein
VPPFGHFSLIRFAKDDGDARSKLTRQLYGNRHDGFTELSQMIPCHKGFIESPYPKPDHPKGEPQWKVFLKRLRTQRWDDHRYYHHSRINQILHFVSAISFLFGYVMIFKDPAISALAGWLVAMTSRQAGISFSSRRI